MELKLKFLALAAIFVPLLASGCQDSADPQLSPPIVINTWNFSRANARAWQELAAGHSALDAVEKGCGQCELDRCDGTVGWGGSPSESGETTLDAMIMDGQSYKVGAVGGLRRFRDAIGVARHVLEHTKHSLLVGEMASQFAAQMGHRESSLTSKESMAIQNQWLRDNCQPNYWRNVEPDPRASCGPYHLNTTMEPTFDYSIEIPNEAVDFLNHDTIGMVAIDSQLRIASGTSTNGLRHKILGRVGDSPIPGAGSYAARGVGAAAATGDGDVIMRFLPSYQAIESLRRGLTAREAARDALNRIALYLPAGSKLPLAGLVVLAADGSYGAACLGIERFPFVISDSRNQVRVETVGCINTLD